jgi:hypothetical protein
MTEMIGKMTRTKFEKKSREMAQRILQAMADGDKANYAVADEALGQVLCITTAVALGRQAGEEIYNGFQELCEDIWSRYKLSDELLKEALANGYKPANVAECGPPEPGEKAWGTWGRSGTGTAQRFLSVPKTMAAKAGGR